MNTQIPRALIYCRVSSSKQKTEGHGLESQEHRCREFAASKGYMVEAVYPDDATGGGDFMLRPGMVSLLSHLDRNSHQNYIVIFDDLKRFARDREFHFKLRGAFASRGVQLECLNYTFDDSPEGEFVETIFAAQGQLERKQNRRQVLQKMKARVENGYYVFPPPMGYKFENIKGDGKMLVRCEPVAPILQEALEGYACGRFANQAEVRRFLEGHPEFPRDSYGKVHAQRVKNILERQLYSGMIELPAWGVSLRKGRHQGLISLETFERIQSRLNGTAYAPARADIREDFPLRGAVACADCGRLYRGAWSKSKTGKTPLLPLSH